jgi:apolipoprotein D and lipocalin family protein
MLPKFLLVLSLVSSVASAEKCPQPPGASNYTNPLFNRLWYEIGKIQTIGGAIFESQCHCTTIDVAFDDANSKISNATVANGCNYFSASGPKEVAVSQIYPTDSIGNFKEVFVDPAEPGTAFYNIVFLSETAAVEYDCEASFGGLINYCFHVLSLTPTMSEAEANALLELVDEYDLNPHNLNFTYTDQKGCTYDRKEKKRVYPW